MTVLHWILRGRRRSIAAGLAVVATAVAGRAGTAAATDTTPPVIVAELSTAPNANGWHRANVRVSFTCTDPGGSGMAACTAPVTITTEGAGQVVTGTARDKAGNLATASVTLNIDRTAPVVTATRTPEAGANGWVTGPVTVTFAASDATSGVAPGSVTAPITLATTRVDVTVRGRATDLAGHVGTVEMPHINIDLSAPRVTLVLTPDATTSGYRAGPVTAHFTCTDAGAGIATCPADQVFTADGKQQVVTGTAVDLVGRTTTVSRTFHIDQTGPVITARFARAADVNGYYTAPVGVTFKCTDALSGVASCPVATTLSADGANAFTVTAVDRAGNTSTRPVSATLDLTAPVLTVSTPSAETTSDTLVVAGQATDAGAGVVSVTVNGAAATLGAGGAFSLSRALVEGANAFTVVATDGAGRTATAQVATTRVAPPPPPPATPANLVADPHFEAGLSGFSAQDASSAVEQSAVSPLEGAHSLRVSIAGYGNNVWWVYPFEGGKAASLSISAHLRSDVASSSDLQFCAMAYYADGGAAVSCTPVSGAAGDKGTISLTIPVDATRPMASARIRMYQEGSAPVTFTLDDALAALEIVELPPTGGGGDSGGSSGDGGGSGGGGGAAPCTVPATSAYPGFTYTLPTVRPFISLDHWAGASPTSTPYLRFKAATDAALGGDPPYAYSATDSVTMFRLTGVTSYIDDAIARVEAFVAVAEADIAAGRAPDIAGDSYLEVGWYLEQLALTYDYGFSRLSDDQKQRWAAFAETSLFNLWHPNEAAWGGVSRPWTGWSVCDPGNNYHFSFLRATMAWALASQNAEWFTFLQTMKFPSLVDYYAALPGGGTREGTGYGTALRSLFENYLMWRGSTGEDLSAITPHTRETIDYWVHATVPTLDRFAPIADQSRVSYPEIFDYQENLVHAAVALSAGTPQARRGTWWLNHNAVQGVQYAFNLRGDLLPLVDTELAPTALTYRAEGAGVFFARSSWDTTASWLSFMAGKYDQSHAHMDQGSFTFFKTDWLAVTPNIWSHSGLHLETEAHNILRFERADGTVIPQSPSDTVASTFTSTVAGGIVTATADLTNAYWRHNSLMQQWTRTLEYQDDVLRVSDVCTVAPGVRAIFQLHVPEAPVVQADGSLRAGHLVIVPLQEVTWTVTALAAPEFSRGYRIDFTSAGAAHPCSFRIELRVQ